MRILKSYLELCRITISFFAACSAATGFLLSPSQRALSGIVPLMGVFLLACGSSALNQYQERDADALMERTKRRPLPSGSMSPMHALIVSFTLMASGLLLLFYTGGAIASCLGAGAVLWYNGVYAYLKKKTAFAAVPGALVGMVPPAIGWASAGGMIFDARLFALCALFFMWQIPHFWLLLLLHGEEYERAGLPSLTRVFTGEQLKRITFVWIFATAAASLAIPLYGTVSSSAVSLSMAAAALWVTVNGVYLLFMTKTAKAYRIAFLRINAYIFLVMTFLSLDSLLP